MNTKAIEIPEAQPVVDIYFLDPKSITSTSHLSEGWYYCLRWEGFTDTEIGPCGPYCSEDEAFMEGAYAWQENEGNPSKLKIN